MQAALSGVARFRRGDGVVMRIVLVDDHELFRIGAREAVASAPDFTFVGEAANARAAFALIDSATPDIVLMDITLPGMDGVVATREIRRRAPKTRVLIMSAHDQIRDVVDALDAGASGYLLKSDGPETLLGALRTVARGEQYLAPALAAECLPAREIARELCIARKTADTHLNRIHRKLGSRNLAELVSLAARLGLSHTGLTRHQVNGGPVMKPTPDAKQKPPTPRAED